MKLFHKKSVGHPMDEWLSFENVSISKFKKRYPELWSVFGESINIARAIPYVIGQQDGLTLLEMHRLILWQKVLHYQVQSLFLLLRTQLDAGYALLRLAAELSRDVVRTADDERMLDIWVARELKPKEYKKHFVFDLNSPDEEAVFNVYKFASVFGVHGHLTDAMYSEVTDTFGKGGPMVNWVVSDYGVLEAVYMWLLSFYPMHHICAKSFIPNYFATRPEIFITLVNHEIAMKSIIQTVSKYLENQKKSSK